MTEALVPFSLWEKAAPEGVEGRPSLDGLWGRMRERRGPSPRTLPAGEGPFLYCASSRDRLPAEGETSHGELRLENNLSYPPGAAFASPLRACPTHQGARKPSRREASH